MKPCYHEQEKKLPCLERENISFGGARAAFNLSICSQGLGQGVLWVGLQTGVGVNSQVQRLVRENLGQY